MKGMRLHDTSRSKFRSFTQPQSNFCTALYKQLANDLLLWKSFAHYFKQSESTMKQTIRVPKQTIWNNLDLGFLDSNHLAETICETNELGLKNPPLEGRIWALIYLLYKWFYSTSGYFISGFYQPYTDRGSKQSCLLQSRLLQFDVTRAGGLLL